MTTRLYFLVPDEQAARKVTDALRIKNINDRDIYAVANSNLYFLENQNIPQAGIMQTSDVLNAAKRGALTGSGVGLFAGLAAAILTPLGIIAAGGAVTSLTLAGAATGAWLASLIGISIPNTDLEAFQTAIDQGKILMLTDVDDADTEAVKQLVLLAYPEAVINSGSLTD